MRDGEYHGRKRFGDVNLSQQAVRIYCINSHDRGAVYVVPMY
jgi:hypothetical protein